MKKLVSQIDCQNKQTKENKINKQRKTDSKNRCSINYTAKRRVPIVIST